MPDKKEQELLEQLQKMPRLTMGRERKAEMLENLIEEEMKWMKRSRTRGTLSLIGKGIAACVILGAVWVGANTLKQVEQATQSPVTQQPNQFQPENQTPQQNQIPGTPTESNGAAPKNDEFQSLWKQQLELAKQGRVEKGGIALESSMLDTIEQQWGKPDQTRFEHGLTFDTYTNRGLDIGANKGMQVVEIRYQNPALKNATMSTVKEALGQPHSIRTTINDQVVYVYKPNEKYELLAIFPAPPKTDGSPTLESIVVRYPQGMINLMADESPTELITRLHENARKGILLNVPVTVGKSVIDQMEKEWGKPTRDEMINGLRYSVYPQKEVVLVSNKGDQIIEIRSYDYQLARLKQSEVRKVLGKPTQSSNVADQVIDLYQISPDYQLKVVYPAATKEIPDPQIDHVNLLYPKGFVNQMAH